MTKVNPEVRIPDPIELDRAEEERLRAAAGLAPRHVEAPEHAGFEQVGIPDRPPQTERERGDQSDPRDEQEQVHEPHAAAALRERAREEVDGRKVDRRKIAAPHEVRDHRKRRPEHAEEKPRCFEPHGTLP